MDYHKDTQKLIDRMCINVERKDFMLKKKYAGECLLKTYDLFNLPRPKKVVWLKDIFDKKFQESARSAWSAWSAGSAWSARSAGSALDYDFDWYVFEFEYCKNPDDDKKPNENDKKYLKYCELLMQAKEYGMGYRVEWEDILYCVPTPLVLIDQENRFHSLAEPAIRWKGGKEFYFISGVNFEKELFNKVVRKELSALEILKLENMEQRMIALKVLGAERMLEELHATLIEKSAVGNELYKLDDIIPDKSIKLLKYTCPSTGRVYTKFVPFEFEKADEAQAWSFQISLQEYHTLKAQS